MGEDMYDLLAKHFSQQTTEEEAAAVQKWIAVSEANATDYRLMEKLWSVSNEQEPITFDTEKALRSVTAQIDEAEGYSPTTKLFTLQRLIAVAAMLVIAFMIWWFTSHNNQLLQLQAIAAVETVALPDGSTIWLREGATLQYPERFDGKERHVRLTGEAFFEIVKDSTKPFIIAANPTEVQVVGTSFSVIADDDSVEVIVKTGKVAFHPAANKENNVFLIPGERALFTHGALTKNLNTNENFNAWQSKQLVFKNTPLAQVVATISDYYHARIDCNHLELTELANTLVTVTFNNQSLASVLQELSLITPYEAKQVNKNHFELLKK